METPEKVQRDPSESPLFPLFPRYSESKEKATPLEEASNEKPLVSIITVVLNAADMIVEALDSVLQQNYTPIEYIVIDGGSTDGTREQLQNFSERIDQLIIEPDEGIYPAMNKGIERASGKWIGILNADDRYLPGAIERAVKAGEEERAGIVHGAMELRFQKQEVTRLNHGEKQLLPYKASINHPTCLVRHSIYKELGTYDIRYRISADHEFLLRAYRSGTHFAYVNTPQVSYRLGGASHTCKSDLETYRIFKEHRTGHHWKCLLRYGKCLTKRAIKTLIGRKT